MLLKEEEISSKPIYNGKVIDVRVDTVRLPNGETATRDVVEHSGAVTIIPMPSPDTVILVRQYRYPTGEVLLELPAGSLGKAEDPRDCACRELAEEIGYHPEHLEELSIFYVAPGYSSEKLHLYLATDLVPRSAQGDADEFIETEVLSLDKAVEMVYSGEIRDAKSIIGLLMAQRRNNIV